MEVIDKVSKGIIGASTNISKDKLFALYEALKKEEELNNENGIWALNHIIENYKVASNKKFPLCDDTGTPHVIIELGSKREITGNLISQINEGISLGLNNLPGRPMGVQGNDIERIEQSKGLFMEPAMVRPASFLIDSQNDFSTYKRNIGEDTLNIHLLLLGGGPEIRAKTYRIFHKKSHLTIFDSIINYLGESLKKLGCTPSIPSIGIGRTHFEANSLMIKTMVYGNLQNQSEIENYISNKLNKSNIGPLGLGGISTTLGTFVNIGNQRASGVRIVSARPSCFIEPRIAKIKV